MIPPPDPRDRLDTSKLGLGGHSIGSVNAFITGTDPRWTTTIHVAGGSFDNVNDPNAPTTGMGGKALIQPAAYVCAANDASGNVQKTQKDYDNTTVPVFFTIRSGSDHLTAVTDGLPAIVACLRWQLGGDIERRSSFLDPQGEFQTGKYMSSVKNWRSAAGTRAAPSERVCAWPNRSIRAGDGERLVHWSRERGVLLKARRFGSHSLAAQRLPLFNRDRLMPQHEGARVSQTDHLAAYVPSHETAYSTRRSPFAI